MQELHDQLMQSCGNAQAELNKQAKSIGEAQLLNSACLGLFVYFWGGLLYKLPTVLGIPTVWGRYIFAVVILHGECHMFYLIREMGGWMVIFSLGFHDCCSVLLGLVI